MDERVEYLDQLGMILSCMARIASNIINCSKSKGILQQLKIHLNVNKFTRMGILPLARIQIHPMSATLLGLHDSESFGRAQMTDTTPGVYDPYWDPVEYYEQSLSALKNDGIDDQWLLSD